MVNAATVLRAGLAAQTPTTRPIVKSPRSFCFAMIVAEHDMTSHDMTLFFLYILQCYVSDLYFVFTGSIAHPVVKKLVEVVQAASTRPP